MVETDLGNTFIHSFNIYQASTMCQPMGIQEETKKKTDLMEHIIENWWINKLHIMLDNIVGENKVGRGKSGAAILDKVVMEVFTEKRTVE